MCGSRAHGSVRVQSGTMSSTPALSQLPLVMSLNGYPRRSRRLTRIVCQCKSGFDPGSRNNARGRGLGSESTMVEWFDDLKVGMRFKSEPVTVSKDDIIRFAKEYDPQPFHLDEEAAKKTMLGGLAASGWHTAAIAMRLAAECKPFGPHPLLGAGVDDLRWLKPVRPGDSIHLEGELVELVPSRSKPHGVARVIWTAYNQNGEAVYTFNPIAIVPSRPK